MQRKELTGKYRFDVVQGRGNEILRLKQNEKESLNQNIGTKTKCEMQNKMNEWPLFLNFTKKGLIKICH